MSEQTADMVDVFLLSRDKTKYIVILVQSITFSLLFLVKYGKIENTKSCRAYKNLRLIVIIFFYFKRNNNVLFSLKNNLCQFRKLRKRLRRYSGLVFACQVLSPPQTE